MITRWEAWFSEDNLAQDERILAAPPSHSAEKGAQTFLARGKRFVLDLACGVGRDTFYLASQGLTVTGADAAVNGVRVARGVGLARGTVSKWVTADARRLPFKDSTFEGVYCFGLLHEFVDEHKEESVRTVMGEIKRLLDAGGILALTVLAGKPEAGLPHVQFFSRPMFDQATQGLRTIEVQRYDDVGCTGRTDYPVWYGVFEK